jgi:hypothetical protein
VGTYYDLLQVGPAAPADEIKRAFRREIARYHPDKVQHLGSEFQTIAATKAADLTQAYETLSDAGLRAAYDTRLAGGEGPEAPVAPPPAPPSAPAVPATAPEGRSRFSEDRESALALLRRASTMRFSKALDGEFGSYEQPGVRGFEVACVPTPAFWSFKLPPRVLGRFVERVDAAGVIEAWGLAARMKPDPQRDLVVFLMGPVVAPPSELAGAIATQRKKPLPAGGRLVLVPTNPRTWQAHGPNDAPPVVHALVKRFTQP